MPDQSSDTPQTVDTQVATTEVYKYCNPDNLHFIGNFVALFGFVVAVVCLWASGSVTKRYSMNAWGEDGFHFPLIYLGVSAIFFTIIAKLTINALSEIIEQLSAKNGR